MLANHFLKILVLAVGLFSVTLAMTLLRLKVGVATQ